MRYFPFVILICSIALSIASCSDDSVPVKETTVHPTIPSINIQTTNSIPWDKKDKCHTVYIENGDTIELSGLIKCRGGMSSRYGKHSYSVEFSKYLSVGGITADDDWILNANYIDKTFQRHKLSYDLFRAMSSENIASRSTYIRVYLNGKYNGLYVAMQKINASMIGLEKNYLGAFLFKDPPIFYEEPIGVFEDSINVYQQKFPKIGEIDASLFLEEFNHLLFSATDKEFDDNIEDHFDLKNIIDWHLILLLTNNDDGLFKNFYLYKNADDVTMRMAIWDYDHSFGRDGDGSLNMMERELNWEKIVFLKRLMESKTLNYPRRLKKRWFELRKELFTKKKIEGMIDENTKLLRPYLDENFERWPLKSKWYKDENTYDQEIEIIKEYLEMRLSYLDETMNKLD